MSSSVAVMSIEAPLLTACALSVSLGGKEVLSGVDLELRSGALLAVVGPNGAGKSTLVRALAGVLPFKGKLILKGRPLRKFSRKERARHIAYVPQAEESSQPFTAAEFVLMGRYPWGQGFFPPSAEDRLMAEESLAAVGAEALSDRPMWALSGGERRKVSIAASLAQGADVLLLDEPGTFLDPGASDLLYRTLAELRRSRGIGVIIVSHDLQRIALYADTVLALCEGSSRFSGIPENFFRSAVLSELYSAPFSLCPHPDCGKSMPLPAAGC